MIDSTTVKVGKAAEILGVSIDTVRRWTALGKIPSIRTPGGTRLYKTTELQNVGKSEFSFVPPQPVHVWFGKQSDENKKAVSQVPLVKNQNPNHLFWGIGLAVSFCLLFVAIVVLWPRQDFTSSVPGVNWGSEKFGSAKILTGQVAVVVFTQAAASSAKILVTPTTLIGQPLAVVSKSSGRFIVAVKNPEKEEINFDWSIIRD